jgi:hypothetical protein
MIKKLLAAFALAAFLFSCNGGNNSNPVTDTDVATAFIRAALDNDFKTAEKYVLPDEVNKQYLETYQRRSIAPAELDKYKAADIIINEIKTISDTVHIVDYTNSYKKDERTKLKLSWVGGKWLVDFKYTFDEHK